MASPDYEQAPDSARRTETTIPSARIENFSKENIPQAAEILREYMLLTELERGNASAETDGLPGVLEREYQEIGTVYQEPNAFFLAYQGDELAGCVGVKLHDQNQAEVSRLYVRPPHRGQNIASQLMDQAEAHARSVGATQLVLDVLPSRHDVISWYESQGFKEIPPFDELPVPMVYLGKPL